MEKINMCDVQQQLISSPERQFRYPSLSPCRPSRRLNLGVLPHGCFKSPPDLGILLIRTEHVPARDSEQKLSPAHTRLLLMGARRSFRWALGSAVETVRNEEI